MVRRSLAISDFTELSTDRVNVGSVYFKTKLIQIYQNGGLHMNSH